jgi:cobalt/nickel transport system permease protein
MNLLSPTRMHIPDGFLSVLLAAAFWIPSIIIVALALRKTEHQFSERLLPRMGVLAAAIFAAQMLNFTVLGGTSGHLLGAALATILLGPWAAILVMACVVGVQALFFQDGGLLALGANLFNLAVVGVAVSFAAYQTVKKLSGRRQWGIVAGGFAAGWASIFICSLSVGLQLALSGVSPANLVLPAMAGIHALIGLGEGVITGSALVFLGAALPATLPSGKSPETAGPDEGLRRGPHPGAERGIHVEGMPDEWHPGWWIAGLAFTLILVILSPLASSDPDGLERVAGQQGFLERAAPPAFRLVPDYLFPGVDNLALATILAGLLGVALVMGVVFLTGASRRKEGLRKHQPPSEPPTHPGLGKP